MLRGLEEHAALPDDDVAVGPDPPVAAGPGAIRHLLAGEPQSEQKVAVRMPHIAAHQPELNVKHADERGLFAACRGAPVQAAGRVMTNSHRR